MSDRITAKERAWLSRNWTPENATFGSWVAGSTKAHELVQRLIAEVERLETAKAFMVDEHKKVSNRLIVVEAKLDEVAEKYHQIAPGHLGWNSRGCSAEYCRTLASFNGGE